MLFDTDILIWIQRGNEKAAICFESAETRYISLQTYMELLQCAPSKKHIRLAKRFLTDFGVIVLPLTEAIGHRAAVYVEEYTASHGLRAGDALVAATASEHELVLATSNEKHFKAIQSLQVKIVKP
jgi:predicted nucleic acid-binding protein